ncbi:unnamed protein product [Orchesella dallaii]|uniref:RING-type domain-containing protein n=1 Tax=Orchesella dallaii TaxID=48710 RepID=A0ABP1R9X0_9HEXA
MECAICWIPLKETLDGDLSKPSDAKRRKMSIWESNAASNLCVTPCGHIFHRSCLERWISQNGHKRCPTCRRRATRKTLYPVFLDVDKKDKCSKKDTSSLLLNPVGDRVALEKEQGRGDFNAELNGNSESDDAMEGDSGESDYDTGDEEEDLDQDGQDDEEEDPDQHGQDDEDEDPDQDDQDEEEEGESEDDDEYA